MPATGASTRPGRVRSLWKAARALWSPEAGSRRRREVELARILDLFEEYVYAGAITPDGRYVHHASMSTIEGLIGGSTARRRGWTILGVAHRAADWAQYEAFNRSPAGRRGRRGDVSRGRAGRRHAGSARSGAPASPGRRQRARRGHHLRHHRARGDRSPPRRGQRPLHQPFWMWSAPTSISRLGTRRPHAELFQGPGGDRLLGGAEPDPEMTNWDAAVHAEDRSAYDAFNRALARGEDSEVTYRLIGADGITRWVHDRGACRPRPDGTFEVSGIVSDVTERRRLEDELRRSMREMKIAHRKLERARADAEVRAGTDELTGTFNRRHFAQIATETLATGSAACGLLLLDADHFKQINDAYGHAVGDAVLIDLAHRLTAGLEPGDVLARWGGEEFAILLLGACSAEELVRRAERFRLAVSDSPIVRDDVHLDLTISVGGALAPNHGATLDALGTGGQLPVSQAPRAASAAPGQSRSADAPNAAPNAVELARAPAFMQPAGRHPAGAR